MIDQKRNGVNTKQYSVAIWGTGSISAGVFNRINCNTRVICFIETEPSRTEFNELPVNKPEWLLGKDIFTVVACDSSKDVHEVCLKLGINQDKFIYMKNAKVRLGSEDNDLICSVLGEECYSFYCEEYGILDCSYFLNDAKKYQELNQRPSFGINKEILKPVLTEKYDHAGSFGLYFWQDLWAAKRIAQTRVRRHFDIGSRIDGFIAHLLAMGVDVTIIDIRRFPFGYVNNLHSICEDATDLKGLDNNSIESLSALCSLEHFGLGRYGDKIDPDGSFKAFKSISRVMKSGGNLFISVPIGRECLEFNAHRMFYASTIIDSFSDFDLRELSSCLDNSIEENIPIHKYDSEYVHGNYRYGLFWFVKK